MTSFIQLADIAAGAAVRAQPVTVWVPSEHIACHWLDVPPVAKKKWQAMIPWLAEERLLDKPENLEFVSGDKQADNKVPVLAVSKTALANWRRQLEAAKVTYTALVPDFFALPWQQGEVTLAILGERCLARTAAWQGMAGPAALILPLLQQQLASGQQRLTVYGEGDLSALAPQLLAGATRADSRQLFGSVRQPWLAIAGGDSNRTRTQSPWPLPGKIAAGLAVLAVALSAAATVLETGQIERQASHFDEQLQRGYRQYFGENYDFDMADFQRVVSARMDGGNGGDATLGQLQQLQQVLSACGDCRIGKLSASGAGVEALVSGQGAARLVASGGARVEQRNNQWAVMVGGEDE